jgi:hypothetical protein
VLTPEELGATVQLFDDNGDGYVSSTEFLTTFFDLGSEEKLRVLRAVKKRALELRAAEKERLRLKVERAMKQTETRVVWPELPADNDEDTRMPPAATPTSQSLLPSLFSPEKQKRRNNSSRKLSMSEILSATLPRELKTKSSLADLFPKASRDTKEFLRDIEKKESSLSSPWQMRSL